MAQPWELISACRQLTNNQARQVLATRLLPFVVMPGKTYYAAAGKVAFTHAAKHQCEIVAVADSDALLAALQTVFGKQILYNSCQHLAIDTPKYSASKRVTAPQVGVLLLLIAAMIAAIWLSPQIAASSFALLFSIVFLSVVALRLASVFSAIEPPLPRDAGLSDAQLPVYTVLVPLFRETAVIRQLLTGLSALNYPAEKLDIKIILEEKDSVTRQAFGQIDLPPHFEVIVVPDAKPQTKPKALNYALHFARGELVVIFDAEDVPEPDQLLLAAQTFATAHPDLVCLQARLTYYNANENWLTRQFTIEYAVLFDVVLPFLAGYRLPLPLGGTSNHFRMKSLRKLGAWDPFNVTEDADLGIRLARFGWYADMLSSATFEEANNEVGNWISQRARWLKGWMQTWLVHMRNPAELVRELGVLGFVCVQIIVAGIVLSTLVHPIFISIVIWQIFTGQFLPPDQSGFVTFLRGAGLAVLITGYAVMMVSGYLALKRRGLGLLIPGIFAMPFYWLLMSVGGWLAVKQFITQPFHWNKTRHGLSKFNRHRDQN